MCITQQSKSAPCRWRNDNRGYVLTRHISRIKPVTLGYTSYVANASGSRTRIQPDDRESYQLDDGVS